MRIELKLIEGVEEPYAVVYAGRMTEEVQNFIEAASAPAGVITAVQEERFIVLKEQDVYTIRVEEEKTAIYCRDKKYYSEKRLYELERICSRKFMKISKTTLINLSYLEGMEASFGGTMLLILQNGCKDYVSRKYLPGLKKYLGL